MQIKRQQQRILLALAALVLSAILFTEDFPSTIERSVVVGTAFDGSRAEPRSFSFLASGTASWYGGEFHGRKTANGEIFDKNALTAAHRTLPFGTIVLVHNLANGKEVLVRINDRGPFVKDRIIDLSEAAGKALDMMRTGTAEVTLYVMKTPASPDHSSAVTGGTLGQTTAPGASASIALRYRVQAGSFGVLANADALSARLKDAGLSPQVETALVNGKTLYRVLLLVEEAALPRTLEILRVLGIAAPLVTKVQ